MGPSATGDVGAVDVEAFVADDERCLASAVPAARVGVVRRPALSFGVGHRPAAAVQARARQRGWELVARRSGGTGLYHAPGDLVWSIVLPRTDPRVGRDYARAYGRLGRALSEWLERRGLPARWAPASGAMPPYCLLNGLGQTLQVDGRALAGAAQHTTRSAMLHHGVVCGTLDPEAIASVFDAPRALVEAHLTGVRALGLGEPPDRLAAELATLLERFAAGGRD